MHARFNLDDRLLANTHRYVKGKSERPSGFFLTTRRRYVYERNHERGIFHSNPEHTDELVVAHLRGGGVLADLGTP